MRIVRSLAGLLGCVFLLLALVSLLSGFTGIDLLGEIVLKLILVGVFLAPALFLLRFATGMKKRWIPLWVFGWVLAVGAALQAPYAVSRLRHVRDVTAKLANAFWICTVPLQLLWGIKSIKFARRASAADAEDPGTSDPRAPILYLRPFRLDSKTSRVRTGRDESLIFNTRTEEELIAQAMNDIGPCVAIGRPGEKLPQLGFNRIYIGDDKWQDLVLDFMKKARLVILMVGSSQGFSWELQRAVEVVEPQHLLFLIPSDTNDVMEFRRVAQTILAHPLPEIPRNAIFAAHTFRAVLYFENDWTPHYAIPEPAAHFRQPLAQKITPTPKMALRPIYAQLNVSWYPPPIVLPRIVYESAGAGFAILAIGILLFGR